MKKRIFVILISAILILSIGVGCARRPEPVAQTPAPAPAPAPAPTPAPEPEPEPEPQLPSRPLRIMWWGSQTRHDRTLGVLEMFTEETGIEFEPEFYGFDDYIAKLNILIAANDAPDLMQLGGNFPTYIDHIQFINEFIDDGTIDISNTDESFIGITTLDGNTVGLASGTNSVAIAYDPALFEKAGVAVPSFDWTWDDFENTVLTINENLGILGMSNNRGNEFWTLTTFINQFGTNQSFFEEPRRLALNYTDDSYVVTYLDMIKRLTDAGAYPNPAQMAEVRDIEGDPLVRGEAAMTFIFANQLVALMDAAQRPLSLAPLPRRTVDGPLAQTIMSSQMFTIAKTSEYQKEAAQFINFFINDVEANQILLGERGVPIMRNVREALSATLTPAQQEIYNYLNELGKVAATHIVLDSPVQAEIRDIYIRIAEEVVFNRITTQEAAQKLREEAQAALDRFNRGN